MHIHENRPGVLTALNKIFAEQGVNIAAQYLQTSAQMILKPTKTLPKKRCRQ